MQNEALRQECLELALRTTGYMRCCLQLRHEQSQLDRRQQQLSMQLEEAQAVAAADGSQSSEGSSDNFEFKPPWTVSTWHGSLAYFSWTLID